MARQRVSYDKHDWTAFANMMLNTVIKHKTFNFLKKLLLNVMKCDKSCKVAVTEENFAVDSTHIQLKIVLGKVKFIHTMPLLLARDGGVQKQTSQ